jgi:hypothetical protein
MERQGFLGFALFCYFRVFGFANDGAASGFPFNRFACPAKGFSVEVGR